MPFKKIKLGKRTMDPISQPFRSVGARVGGGGKGRSEAVGQRSTEKSMYRKRERGTFKTPHPYEVSDTCWKAEDSFCFNTSLYLSPFVTI